MNTAHMTSQDWAQYIQTYQPTNETELQTYLTDLVNYAKTGDIESGISLLRVKQISFDWPQVLNSHEYNKIEHEDRTNQNRIRSGFFGNK